MFLMYTVSTTQPNFLIYSEAADTNLYIRKCFQIYRIFTNILGNVSEYIILHHCLRIYYVENLSEFVLTVYTVRLPTYGAGTRPYGSSDTAPQGCGQG